MTEPNRSVVQRYALNVLEHKMVRERLREIEHQLEDDELTVAGTLNVIGPTLVTFNNSSDLMALWLEDGGIETRIVQPLHQQVNRLKGD